MERVKIFNAGSDDFHMEERINKWLEEMNEKIEITRVLQDICSLMSNHFLTTITIFYKIKVEEKQS